jgi:hypothetical protein
LRIKRPTPAQIGLTEEEGKVLRALRSPEAIQAFVIGLRANFEEEGDTLRSVRGVLKHGKAHCIEAAFVAACALWLQGLPPLLLDMTATKDDSDHVIAVFRRGSGWGAISKSNHVWLRWRDPVYRSPRELVMSYFHEYTRDHDKTLRSYSVPVDLRRFPPGMWITSAEDCWEVGAALCDVRHFRLLTRAQERRLMPRDEMELRADDMVQYDNKDRIRARRY